MSPLEYLFFIALFMYSFVIWRHRFTHKLSSWMVWLFGLGLLADAGGTVLLCVVPAESWQFTLHTVSGLLALLIMALHFLWALPARVSWGESRIYFDRFSVYAWYLWLIAFMSGIPLS